MTQAIALAVPTVALATLLAVPARAWWLRGRPYAAFSAIVLAIAMPGALVLHARLAGLVPPHLVLPLHAGFAWGMAAGLHLAGLARARLRRRPFRWLVSIPGMAFQSLLAIR